MHWNYYKALFDCDSERDIRVAPKLTKIHINPGPFDKMRVSYATQVKQDLVNLFACKYIIQLT